MCMSMQMLQNSISVIREDDEVAVVVNGITRQDTAIIYCGWTMLPMNMVIELRH